MLTLSFVVPFTNEEQTLRELFERLAGGVAPGAAARCYSRWTAAAASKVESSS